MSAQHTPGRRPQPVLVVLDDAAVERACRAHWPTWDRMRPDHQRKWRAKMADALAAIAKATGSAQ